MQYSFIHDNIVQLTFHNCGYRNHAYRWTTVYPFTLHIYIYIYMCVCVCVCSCCSVTKSCLTLWLHGLQRTRLPCPSLSPWVCSNSSIELMPSSHLILCHPFLLPQSLLASGSFQWVSSLHQVAKIWELQLQHQSFRWISSTDFFRID